jgi:alcohol dehydrogenase
MAPLPLPITLGSDFSGTVQEIAADVEGVKPGDDVYGLALVLGGGSGSLAQYAVTTASNVARKPVQLTHEEAASLVVVGAAAVRVVEEFIEPHMEGKKVLVQGGTGGVGTIVTQYLKHLGATVDVTVPGETAVDFAKQLGANEVINADQDRAGALRDYDVILDTVGGKVYEESFGMLRKGGLLVTMSELPNDALAAQHKVSVTSVAQQKPSATMAQSLDHLSELIEQKVGHILIKYLL